MTAEPGVAQPPGDLEAADVGQPDVEDDALDAGRVLGDLEAALAVGGELDHVPVVLEQALEQAPQAGIVLDDEEMHDGQPSRFVRRYRATVTSPAVRSGGWPLPRLDPTTTGGRDRDLVADGDVRGGGVGRLAVGRVAIELEGHLLAVGQRQRQAVSVDGLDGAVEREATTERETAGAAAARREAAARADTDRAIRERADLRAARSPAPSSGRSRTPRHRPPRSRRR